MIRPGVVPDATIYCLVRIAGALGAEFPYRPVISVFCVEEGYESIKGVAVGTLGICLGGARAIS
jgi:hypothetical protein